MSGCAFYFVFMACLIMGGRNGALLAVVILFIWIADGGPKARK
jgi:hypothetical protein